MCALKLTMQKEIAAAAKGAQALLVGYATISKDLIDQLPELEVVSMLSTGTDNVDSKALADRNIALVDTRCASGSKK
jgi:lactate dehydrogenase-like 2-hydroxyacid dehydrogenase